MNPEEIATKLDLFITHAESLMNDEEIERDRTYILEDLIARLDVLTEQLRGRTGLTSLRAYAYPMRGEDGQ